MAQIGTLLTGAGVQTNIVGQAQCDEYILIGDVDTANPLQALQVEIDGNPFINIIGATLITAFMKWKQELTASTVGLLLKVATGVIPRNTTYRFTNSGATTPAIYAFSDSPGGIPISASTVTINPQSSQVFEKFSALFIATPANVSTIEVEFTSGQKSILLPVEADALFSLSNQSEANGQLGGVTVLDNSAGIYQSVRIYTNATAGGTAVLVAKLPDAAFQALKEL